jgi:hypothetical protein
VPLTTTTNLIRNYLSNAATITANTSTGTITQALRLPGTVNSFVNFQSGGSSVALIPTNTTNVFVEAWINPGVTTSGVIVAVGTGSQLWNLYLSGASFLTFNAAGGGTQTASSLALSAGTWYHVAVSLTPALTTKANIWVNGTQTTYSSTATALPAALASANVYIGQNFAGGNFTGNVADVRIWSGGIIPTTATRPSGFTATAAPFGTSQPAYITGTPTLQMSLQSQYFPGASTSPYGPCLTLPGTVGSYYVQLPSAAHSDWKTTGFTLEAWVNFASLANSNVFNTGASYPLMITTTTPPPNLGSAMYGFGPTTTGQIAFVWWASGGTNNAFVTSNTITTGTWNHLMVQGNGSNVYMAINGNFTTLTAQGFTPTSGAGTIAPTLAPSTTAGPQSGSAMTVGQYYTYQGPNFSVAKARLIYGANVYSSGSFTPSPNFATSATAPFWSLESQYPLPTYPSIQDVTPLPSQLTSYGATPVPVGGVTSNVLGPYTANTQFDSIRFDGTGYIDYGNAASSVMTTNIWASNWTIEGWVYPTNVSNAPTIIQRTAASTYTYDWSFWLNSNQISFVSTPSLGGTATYNTGSVSYPVNLNTWTHVAATSDGTRSNVYVGGQLANTMPISAMGQGFNPQIATQIGTGAYGTNYNFIGNLADVRVSNVARYTGSTYTVPNVADGSGPFVTDRNTLLLLKSLAGQTGTTLEVQGRGLNAVSLGATRSVQSYPPAPMSSYLLDTTGNTAVSYGQGKYVASASTENTGGAQFAWKAFTKNANGSTANGSWLPLDFYGGGAYQGAVTTVDVLGNSYPGGWLQIQMPVSIILSSYQLATDGGNQLRTWVILGSRDGINWTLVDSQPFTTAWTDFVQRTFTPTTTQAYNYFRLVASNSSGNNLVLYTFVLNGTEESLCVTSDSKVGVGIANPQRSLEVAGDLVVSGTISGGAGLGSFRNRIINGDMRIAQRGTSAVILGPVTQNYYGAIDRWKSTVSWTAGQVTVSRQTLTASDNPYQNGLQYSQRYTVNSALTGFSYLYITQLCELVTVADFNLGTPFGSPFTVSLWFRSNIPAGSTMCAAVQTYISSQMSYVTEFKTTGTWQYVTFTVPPMTTAQGVLNSDNFLLSIGSLQNASGFVTPSSNVNTWASGINSLGSAAMYNWWNNAGNYIEFTGVQLEKGTVATPWDVRPYAQELALCQRSYYQIASPTPGSGGAGSNVYSAYGVGMNYTTTSGDIVIPFPVALRTPTHTFTSSAASTFQVVVPVGSYPLTTIAGGATDSQTTQTAKITYTVAAGLTAGNAAWLRSNNLYGTTTSFFGFSAEL